MAYKDPVAHILEILHDNFGDTFFKAYFDGDPLEIGQSSLPCVSVSYKTMQFTADNAPTGFDHTNDQIIIKLILSKKDDLGASPDVDLTEKKLRILIAGRNDDGTMSPTSVIGALRTKFTAVSDLTLNQSIDVTIGTSAIPRTVDTITAEGHVTITIEGLQQMLGRT